MMVVEQKLEDVLGKSETAGEFLRALHCVEWERRVHEASTFREMLELLWQECIQSNAAVFLYNEVRNAMLGTLASLMTAGLQNDWNNFYAQEDFRRNAKFSRKLCLLKNIYIVQLAEEYLFNLERQLYGKTIDLNFWEAFSKEDSLEGKLDQLQMLTIQL